MLEPAEDGSEMEVHRTQSIPSAGGRLTAFFMFFFGLFSLSSSNQFKYFYLFPLQFLRGNEYYITEIVIK